MKSILLLACSSVLIAVAAGSAIIDSGLQKRFIIGGGGGETQNVMVSFTQGIQTVIQRINQMNFSSTSEKRTALTNAQQTFADSVQRPLQTFLNTMGVNYQSFWINNRMVVPNVNSGLVNAISNIPGVARIEEEPKVNIHPMYMGEPEEMDIGENRTRFSRQSNAEWGVRKIRADQVWESYKGQGIVVAGIDTGVRYTHLALKDNWRSSYGWYDPYQKTSTPNDQNGHGTHTIGTIAGTYGLGVAPEAKWIACKGCDSRSCGGSQLYACGQWVQCPTLPNGSSKNCNMAPDVVSNSWGSSGGQSWYDDIINSWQAAGIVPVFSIGNSGPECNTAGSPGDRPRNIAVGSTDSNDRISSFSSLGPSQSGTVKPDIAAPGGQIRSAWYTSNSALNTISGTSMACPHVSGVVALMLQKNPSLSYTEVYNAITSSAEKSLLDTTNTKTCGGKSPSTFPNNVFGYGRIDAVNSVDAV